MEEGVHTERRQQMDQLFQQLREIKSYIDQDATSDVSQVIDSNCPETCLAYLENLEKRGDPQTDPSLLSQLIDAYTRVVSRLEKYSHNKSYAKILVRFAELKAIQDPDDAYDNFIVATSNCKAFAFVHVAYAQYELSQGNWNKSASILKMAYAENAKPTELLDNALKNLKLGKNQLLSCEDKENIAVSTHYNIHDSAKSRTEFSQRSRSSGGTGDLQLGSLLSSTEQRANLLEDPLLIRRTASQKKSLFLPGRVPLVPLFIPETDDSDDSVGQPVRKSDELCPNNREAYGSRYNLSFSSNRKRSVDGDSYNLLNLKPTVVSPEEKSWEARATVDSTTALMEKQYSLKTEDTTSNFSQVLDSRSPESCMAYLVNLEKRGDPHADAGFLSKLIDAYTRVFSRLSLHKYSHNESYARMLVRFAELKGILEPEEAQENFAVAKSNCKPFAFVHIAFAQFELSKGNVAKSESILKQALKVNARPPELLHSALQNLKRGRAHLLSPGDKESITTDTLIQGTVANGTEVQDKPEGILKGSDLALNKPQCKELALEWKIPGRISKHSSTEDKPFPVEPVMPLRVSDQVPSLLAPTWKKSILTCQTPSYKTPNTNNYATPVQKSQQAATPIPVSCVPVRPLQPCTPVSRASCVEQTLQGAVPTLSSNCITIKGKQFRILKVIGRGGSSKVFQVQDQYNELFAVKYVNLEEAETQTIESYKNEIEHLNRLQQYSDQIIRLYEYEVTNSYIYMLMECGNLDLNTWLRNHKTVDPLERKSYWKNMLKAVQTIHRHGIVHSDLKPANFVIVNGSLKLIDFGIASRIEPDLTSIVKDSQVGTVNYMPPEALKDASAQAGKPHFKISPKADVWSLGCILYQMTYSKTPFQSITRQINRLHAIVDSSHHIDFPDIPEKDLLDVLKRCLVRDPKERISIDELLAHPFLQAHPQQLESSATADQSHSDLRQILNDLAALNSPNTIARAAKNLAKRCNSGKKLDVSECI